MSLACDARDVEQSLAEIHEHLLELVEGAAHGGSADGHDANLIGALGRLVTARRNLSGLRERLESQPEGASEVRS